jgi:hypothetical protein
MFRKIFDKINDTIICLIIGYRVSRLEERVDRFCERIDKEIKELGIK